MKRKFLDVDLDGEVSSDRDLTRLKKVKVEVEKIQKNIRDTEPNLLDIFSSNIFSEDKEHIYEIYKIYENTPPFSLEKYNLKMEITRKFSDSKKRLEYVSNLSEEKKLELKSKIKKLEESINPFDLEYKIAELETTSKNISLIYATFKRFQNMSQTNEEYGKIKYWLDWAIKLPYDKIYKPIHNNSHTNLLIGVKRYLDDNLYGMEKTKEQILLYINKKMLYPSSTGNSLGLIGPPGCGKTTVARLLSHALKFPFVQISLGGVDNPEYLKGHQYTFIGAEPGEIVKAMCKLQVKNGIVFFDEYDRISGNKAIVSALLHITDASQNTSFEDNFLSGLSFDLSQIWFLYSMNNKPTDRALSDRIFYVEVPDYSSQEKVDILNFIWSKLCISHGFTERQKLCVDRNVFSRLIIKFPNEGIRGLTYKLSEILNKLNFHLYNFKKLDYSFSIKEKLTFPFHMTIPILEKLL